MELAALFVAFAIGIGIAIAIVILVVIARQFLFVAQPNEILIFSGRQRAVEGGGSVGYSQLIGGGRRLRIPVLEKVDRMDLNTLPIDVQVINAYSKGGIPLKVHAVANIRVSADPKVVRNAIERFLGRDPAEIRRVAKETLEGHLRGVLSRLTPEEVNEDRLKFAGALVDEAEQDFHKLGLELDTFKIQNVSDDTKYLDSIGRGRIAEVKRDAELAESNAVAEAKQAEAAALQRGDVAKETAQTIIVQRENELRQLKAELDANARVEEERATAAAAQARAEAELELQDIRKKLEQLRLVSDVVLPAQAEREAAALRARGDAAAIEENGRALAEVLKMTTAVWLKAGKDARDIFLIQQIEEVLRAVVTRVKALQLHQVVLLDSGDGNALPRHMASYPAMVREVLEELRNTTGVDIPGLLSPERTAPTDAAARREVK